jgi:hypothetical protein
MKVKSLEQTDVFSPVSIGITFETREELEKLTMLMAHPVIEDYLSIQTTVALTDALDKVGAKGNMYQEYLDKKIHNYSNQKYYK